MSALASDHTGRRVRTSESALRIALKVAKDEGMVVDKLCIRFLL